MAADDAWTDRETIRLQCSVPVDVVERLAQQYPSALTPQDALRMAIDEALENRERSLTREDVRESVRESLDQSPVEVEFADEE